MFALNKQIKLLQIYRQSLVKHQPENIKSSNFYVLTKSSPLHVNNFNKSKSSQLILKENEVVNVYNVKSECIK